MRTTLLATALVALITPLTATQSFKTVPISTLTHLAEDKKLDASTNIHDHVSGFVNPIPLDPYVVEDNVATITASPTIGFCGPMGMHCQVASAAVKPDQGEASSIPLVTASPAIGSCNSTNGQREYTSATVDNDELEARSPISTASPWIGFCGPVGMHCDVLVPQTTSA